MTKNNLYSRLRPDFKKVLLSQKEYHTVKKLISKLKWLDYVSDMTVDDVKKLVLYATDHSMYVEINTITLNNFWDFEEKFFKKIKI